MYLKMISYFEFGAMTTTYFTSEHCSVIDGYYPADGTKTDISVIDQFDIWLDDTSANNKLKLNEIRCALESASEFYRKDRRAYLLIDIDQNGIWRRSPIRSGRVIHNPKLTAHYKHSRMRLTIIIERDPWWENIAYQYLFLTNDYGTGSESGLRIYNCNDGATVDTTYVRNNYAIISGAVDGDLPAPVLFTYLNNADLDIQMRTIHVWNNKDNDPVNYTALREGEDLTSMSSTSLTGASAGYVGSLSIPNCIETSLGTCSLYQAAYYSRGSHFVAVIRFKYDQIANLEHCKFRLLVTQSNLGTIFQSDWFYANADTGYPVMIISPPFMVIPDEAGYLPYIPIGYLLELYVYQESGSSLTLAIDDIFFMPVSSKNLYRKVGTEGADLNIAFADYTTIVDNQIQNITYLQRYFSTAFRNVVIPSSMGNLYVWPGVGNKNRFTWLFGMTTATTQTQINSAYLHVFAQYLPRWRTL